MKVKGFVDELPMQADLPMDSIPGRARKLFPRPRFDVVNLLA